jgi:protein-S-isoprenylcysteine O-methyltransferase Ste14
MRDLGKVVLALVIVVTLMGATIFLFAWSLDYWEAWAFLAVYAACSAITAAYLWRHDRALLARRMRGGPASEREPAQRIIMTLASAGFIALLAVSAVDHRLHWSPPIPAIAAVGNVLLALGFFADLLVFRENSFAAATITVAPNQRVVSTGPYAVVRHPMYAGALVLLLGIPLALGSLWGVVILACMVPVLIWRLLDEERVLAEQLPGYREYQARVRWRLIPAIF